MLGSTQLPMILAPGRANGSDLFRHPHSDVDTHICVVYTHVWMFPPPRTLDYIRENMGCFFFQSLIPLCSQSFLVPPFVAICGQIILQCLPSSVSSSVGKHLGWFCNLSIVNKHECVGCWFGSLGICAYEWCSEHMIVFCVWEPSILISMVAGLIYIPAGNIKEFLSTHILSIAYLMVI